MSGGGRWRGREEIAAHGGSPGGFALPRTSPAGTPGSTEGSFLILAGGEGGGGVDGVEELVLVVLDARDGFAGDDLFDEVVNLGAEEGVALDGAVQFSVNDGLDGFLDGVDREDGDVGAGFEAGFLDGLDGAEGHVVVVGVNDFEIAAVFFEEGFHDLLAAGAAEVAALGVDDLEVGVFRDGFGEGAAAFVGGGGAGGALEFEDAALAVDVFGEPVGGHATFLGEVGADEAGEEGFVGDLDGAVHEDDGDLRAFGVAEDGFPAGFDDGRDDDGVDALGDEGADGADLVFLAALAVGELQVDAAFGGFVLHRFGVGGAPSGFGAGLGEADGEGFGDERGGGAQGHREREEEAGEFHGDGGIRPSENRNGGEREARFEGQRVPDGWTVKCGAELRSLWTIGVTKCEGLAFCTRIRRLEDFGQVLSYPHEIHLAIPLGWLCRADMRSSTHASGGPEC